MNPGPNYTYTILMPSTGTWYFQVAEQTTAQYIPDYSSGFKAVCSDAVAGVDTPTYQPLHNDGRLNNDEATSPVAIYSSAVQGLDFYTINGDSAGTLAFTVNEAFVNALPAPTGSTTLVDTFTANGVNFRVYWLATGKLQLNIGPDADGVEYVYIIDATTLTLIEYYSFS